MTDEGGRERILAAALKLFTARGFDRVTVRDIGHEAGLTNPALYRHFADKEALGCELYRQCYFRNLQVVAAATANLTNPLDKIEAYVAAEIGLFECEPEAVLYIDEHQVRFWPAVEAEIGGRTLSGQVGAWVKAARRLGEIGSNSPAEFQVALVMGCLSQWFAMRAAGVVGRKNPHVFAKFVRDRLSGRE